MKYTLRTTILKDDWIRKEVVHTFKNKDELIAHLLHHSHYRYTLEVSK